MSSGGNGNPNKGETEIEQRFRLVREHAERIRQERRAKVVTFMLRLEHYVKVHTAASPARTQAAANGDLKAALEDLLEI